MAAQATGDKVADRNRLPRPTVERDTLGAREKLLDTEAVAAITTDELRDLEAERPTVERDTLVLHAVHSLTDCPGLVDLQSLLD